MNTQETPAPTTEVATTAQPEEKPATQPNLPPIPPKHTLSPSKVQPVIPPSPPTPKQVEDPTWWRKGAVPFIVLLLAAAAADFYWPRSGGLGLGAGIAGILLTTGMVMLRKDLSKGEVAFLIGLALINFMALAVSGNALNYWAGLVAPFFILAIPSDKAEPESINIQTRHWWSYWLARRPKADTAKKGVLRSILPTLISLIAAVALFIAFLTIFASGNPVVEQVWQWIVSQWNNLVSYLNISWDFMWHLLYWGIGILAFGIYARRRPYAPKLPSVPAKPVEGITLLPHLPLFSLIGINAAFLVATSTDIAYLWFKNIPEGISQTQYLHDGADSIIWASILAALVLVVLFRRMGIARRSIAAKLAGYLLVIQTFLLAASVYMRLFYQICDYGFTYRRILAGEFLLLGLVGLVILVFYMACDGRFWRFAKICLGTLLLLVIAGGIITPSRLAATLNLYYMDSNPHWKFNSNDFRLSRFNTDSHLAFAEIIYHQNPNVDLYNRLYYTAKRIAEKEGKGDWTTFTLNHYYDLPAAKRILEMQGPPVMNTADTTNLIIRH